MNFSVLMSIYYKENPAYFHRAMESIYNEQSVKPNEIVLVEDGRLTEELYASINFWKNILNDTLKIVTLKENVGLGKALNIGLSECTHNLVARMDTDDISLPHRFERQLHVFSEKDIDICGTWISEFDSKEQEIIAYRKVPQMHDTIVTYSKKRNPLNHPSVMYKKSRIEQSGNYQVMQGFEDYYLWTRAIQTGLVLYNIQEALVHMRAGYGQLERRGGVGYAYNEILFQHRLYTTGYIHLFEYIRNITLRTTIRLFPKYFLKRIYKSLRD